jgi:hypothetical protein
MYGCKEIIHKKVNYSVDDGNMKNTCRFNLRGRELLTVTKRKDKSG